MSHPANRQKEVASLSGIGQAAPLASVNPFLLEKTALRRCRPKQSKSRWVAATRPIGGPRTQKLGAQHIANLALNRLGSAACLSKFATTGKTSRPRRWRRRRPEHNRFNGEKQLCLDTILPTGSRAASTTAAGHISRFESSPGPFTAAGRVYEGLGVMVRTMRKRAFPAIIFA